MLEKLWRVHVYHVHKKYGIDFKGDMKVVFEVVFVKNGYIVRTVCCGYHMTC